MGKTLMNIRSIKDRLRNSEKKVAEYVLSHPDKVIRSSITDVAEEAATSEPTVIRFCRSMGLRGFMDLKLKLARDLPSSKYIHENVSEDDSLPEIFNKLFNSSRESISNTMRSLDLKLMEQACDALAKARRIEFYGVGGSGVVARDAYHKFFRLGIACSVYDDPHMQVMSAALLGEQDVVVAISHSGSTRDILESIAIAKNKGATIIGIVGEHKSPMAKLCDITLSVNIQEAALRFAPMASRLVQLVVIDVLFVSVAMKGFDKFKERLDDVKHSLVDKRY